MDDWSCVCCQVDGYVARFDSDVVNGDSGVLIPGRDPSVPCNQLTRDMTPMMSHGVLSSTPATNLHQRALSNGSYDSH